MSDPLLQQLPALIGVAVGALATYATTTLGERSRWRRERDARWDDARMRAYAEYGNAVKTVSVVASRIAAGRGFPHSLEPVAPDPEALQVLENAEGERARAWESVLLLGEPRTIAAARVWHENVWQLVWFARGRLTAIEQWDPSLRRADTARDKFYDCARQDLGVKGGAVPTPVWPPEWIQKLPKPDESHKHP